MRRRAYVYQQTNQNIAPVIKTDLAMGVIGKSLYISEVIAELQGNTSSTYCIRTLLATSRFKCVRYSITVSLSHGEPREVYCHQTCPAVRNHRHWKTPHVFVCSSVDYIIDNNCLFFFLWRKHLSLGWHHYFVSLHNHYYLLSSCALPWNT